jgi:hypothetical protein
MVSSTSIPENHGVEALERRAAILDVRLDDAELSGSRLQ